jgi:Peptidase A4 family
MRRPHFPRLLTLPAMGALVAATVMAAGSVTAGAATAGSAFGPYIGGPHINEGNWGGYAVGGSKGEFTKISGSWKEPVAKCASSKQLTAPWIGLDGYGTSTVEQTGVAVECTGTKVSYQGWYEMYPRSPVYFTAEPVSANDVFDASVTFNGGKSYTLVLHDVTKSWTKTIKASLSGASNATAEAVIEDPTGSYPNLYDGVTFSSVTVNGKSFKSYAPSKLTSGGYIPGSMNANGGFTIKK